MNAFARKATAATLGLCLVITHAALADTTVTVDGRSVNVSGDLSSLSGSNTRTSGADTVAETYSGTIGRDGVVAGSYNAVTTRPDGTTSTESGIINGTIDSLGKFNASWDGPGAGSTSGEIPQLAGVYTVGGSPGGPSGSGGSGGPGGSGGNGLSGAIFGGYGPGVLAADTEVSETTTRALANAIILNIKSSRDECASLGASYRVDCLSQGLRMTAERMPATGRFGAMRQEVLKASQELASIVRRDGDRSARLEVPKGLNRRFALRRAYIPIRPSRLNDALAEAERIATELETNLMRATTGGTSRAAHYQRVAVAFGSVKTLLRS